MSRLRLWLYVIRIWLVVILVAVPGGALAIALPGQQRRRLVARNAARLVFRCSGIAIDVRGLEQLPAEACMVAANHQSYLDGVVLTAALPPRFSFIIKQEMKSVPVLGLLLRRLGSQFIERSNPHGSALDARRVLRIALRGHALGVFPEGTFAADPGLAPFRLGSFLIAARANLTVVPVAIRGTRAVLPAGRWIPQRHTVSVVLAEPVAPVGEVPREVARRLRDTVRRRILAACGETDLELC